MVVFGKIKKLRNAIKVQVCDATMLNGTARAEYKSMILNSFLRNKII